MPFLPLVLATVLLAAAEDPPPQVPDPIGLGPRLALIDYLRSEWKLNPRDGATYQELCRIYWAEHRRRQGQRKDEGAVLRSGDVDEAALTRDRERRMREELKRRYGIEAPAAADETALAALMREARERALAQATPTADPQPARTPRADGSEKAASGGRSSPAGAGRSAPAAPADPMAAWKDRLARLWWAREQQIPPVTELGWSARQPDLATVANRYRLQRGEGEFQYEEQAPPAEPGLKVWINVSRLEPSGFGTAVPRFQTDRWIPGWWSSAEGRWITEPPGKASWIRDSQASQAVMALLLRGPKDDLKRESEWRRLHSSLAGGKLARTDPLPGDLAGVFAAAAIDAGVRLDLEPIERLTLEIEQRWPLVARYEETLMAAQNQARGNDADPTVTNAVAQLNSLGAWFLTAHEDRRGRLRASLEALGVPVSPPR